MEQLLSVLYGVSGVAAAALYLPQILKYHRDHEARHAISLLSWGGWILIAAITILYALFVVNSRLMAAVAGLNTIAQLAVLWYGVSARCARAGMACGEATTGASAQRRNDAALRQPHRIIPSSSTPSPSAAAQ